MRFAWRDFFREWDVVVCPIAACVAFEHQHGAYHGRKLRVDGVEAPYLQRIGDAYANSQTIEFARLAAEEIGGFQPPPDLE
jgi:amidase